ENSLFEVLPIKLKSDLAISVHYHTLSKVSLFQNCERALIYDMILKLKPVVFLPMDYICRKRLPNLHSLSPRILYFSLLALTGKNRRTADVRSKGFSTLFSLSKQDFEEIMKNYPQAHRLLQKRSQRMLNRDKKKHKEAEMAKQAEKAKLGTTENQEEPVVEVIPERLPTPRLLETVVQGSLFVFLICIKKSRRMLNRDKKKHKEAEMAKQAGKAKLGTTENQEEPVVEVIPERLPTPRLLETVV
ncbi:hypothetical protein X801_07926, partial [Opisthorchis viverrini]